MMVSFFTALAGASTTAASSGAAAAAAAGTAATATAAAGASSAAVLAAHGAIAAKAAAAAKALSVTKILSSGLSIFSAATSILGGIQQGQSAKVAAKFSDFQARNEVIRGRRESADIRLRLARTLASQNAIGGAGGIDFTTGSSREVAAASARAAQDDIETVSLDAATAAAAYRSQATQHRLAGRAARFAGFGRAAGSLFDLTSRNRALYG